MRKLKICINITAIFFLIFLLCFFTDKQNHWEQFKVIMKENKNFAI